MSRGVNAPNKTQMESASDITELKERVQRLENTIRTQSDLISQLIERVGETFAKQAFTIEDLMRRWGCGETLARKIIRSHKLKLLRGADGKPRKPYAVLRTSVLAYENGETMLAKRRATKPVPTWAERPFMPKPESSAQFGQGVRKLGE